jgi:hypothetical protein
MHCGYLVPSRERYSLQAGERSGTCRIYLPALVEGDAVVEGGTVHDRPLFEGQDPGVGVLVGGVGDGGARPVPDDDGVSVDVEATDLNGAEGLVRLDALSERSQYIVLELLGT